MSPIVVNPLSPYPIRRHAGPFYGLPAGVPPPPPAAVEMREAAFVRNLNQNRSPEALRWTEFLDKEGGYGLWKEFARQYRRSTGFVRGWAGTALMHVALGVNALRTNRAKNHYQRLRPFEVDPGITRFSGNATGKSYPSGHTSSAFAASTVLGFLWPQRAHEFEWWARQVGMSRMHNGVHFPSDVAAGERLGRIAGMQTASILF
jgi:acid phosphatase (class A)